ncbi:hypothetical protein PUNSTDRAFT_145255 [Punctularia strigosozonata HHB-11173 SS5]|uniref:uncharacterized protein n=1 Tax=Punctularia strigosozonata (strain HHB-11173) TaxID=741275 RepID=UPI000441636F|nr:uncharacterized protein PUNSTDRAFT_145255 [Punctularia strigosozonata HHB-11173 SS5]EIN06750.1 hypothetical protein PUNSTDRAFT_145255 [Punctularia strigosozonata HHB-11173 SS5]
MAPTQTSQPNREERRRIAESTLEALERGSYTLDGVSYSLAAAKALAVEDTRYYAPDSFLDSWKTMLPDEPRSSPPTFSVIEISTLEGARLLREQTPAEERIGILNFASAKKPGGGFLSGAQAQEESIARSSTLYPSLMSSNGQQFYKNHKKPGGQKGGYYSHAMIYTPGVVLFRADDGKWLEPLEVESVTSAAVNAGVARNTLFGRVGGQSEEARIAEAMKERMARILFLFEQQGVRNVVLGSFGTGVFKNDVRTVARLWRELLKEDGNRFGRSFERVMFAIIGKQTYDDFRHEFEKP